MIIYSNSPDENLGADEVMIRVSKANDAAAFRRLSEVWISKYFVMEEQDHLTLTDPESSIVMEGGQIYMAVLGDRVVGCCALIAKGDGVYELAKMAVDETMQGRGIGKMLLTFTLAEARRSLDVVPVGASFTRFEAEMHRAM